MIVPSCVSVWACTLAGAHQPCGRFACHQYLSATLLALGCCLTLHKAHTLPQLYPTLDIAYRHSSDGSEQRAKGGRGPLVDPTMTAKLAHLYSLSQVKLRNAYSFIRQALPCKCKEGIQTMCRIIPLLWQIRLLLTLSCCRQLKLMPSNACLGEKQYMLKQLIRISYMSVLYNKYR